MNLVSSKFQMYASLGSRYPTSKFLEWCLIARVENEKIISQIVRISEVCNQNGDRVLSEWQKYLYLQ